MRNTSHDTESLFLVDSLVVYSDDLRVFIVSYDYSNSYNTEFVTVEYSLN